MLNEQEKLNYPKHKHPHGIDNAAPSEFRIWVCEECQLIFSDSEIRKDKAQWGHICKSHPCRENVERCESHLEPYIPELPQPSPELEGLICKIANRRNKKE